MCFVGVGAGADDDYGRDDGDGDGGVGAADDGGGGGGTWCVLPSIRFGGWTPANSHKVGPMSMLETSSLRTVPGAMPGPAA